MNNVLLSLFMRMLLFDPRIRGLSKIDAAGSVMTNHNTIKNGLTFDDTTDTEHYTKRQSIEDGIERIAYIPKNKMFETPILMTHGMWHSAWCWEWWMQLLAEWGWECHAYSLPGHGKSPVQRPIQDCTLDYYTSFLRCEVERLDHSPILMGHSMGGAITQWYLRYVRDDVPAVVLVASWVARAAMIDGFIQLTKVDPVGVMRVLLAGDATPYIRSPRVAARKLISNRAIISPEALYAHLSPESALVTIQHNPPFWAPKDKVRAPILYLAGALDAVLSNHASQKTAEHYGAEFVIIQQAAHNLMMERNYRESANCVHDWLQSVVEKAAAPDGTTNAPGFDQEWL